MRERILLCFSDFYLVGVEKNSTQEKSKGKKNQPNEKNKKTKKKRLRSKLGRGRSFFDVK